MMAIIYTHNPELDRENIEKEIEENNKKIKELEIKILKKFCDIAENAIAITNIHSDMINNASKNIVNMQEQVDLIDQKHELTFDCIKGITRIL
jgi:hypothetical protein